MIWLGGLVAELLTPELAPEEGDIGTGFADAPNCGTGVFFILEIALLIWDKLCSPEAELLAICASCFEVEFSCVVTCARARLT